MSSEEYADPLVAPASEGPDRLHYAIGMMLDAEDFADEQRYHRGRLARALRYLFGTGTVAGLDVEEQPGGGAPTEEIRVTAGLAIDPLGRLLELPRAVCMDLGRWFDAVVADDDQRALLLDARDVNGMVVVDVFARFCVCPRGLTPAFATGPYDALDAARPSRLRDGVEVFLAIRANPAFEPPPASLPLWDDAPTRAARRSDGWREGSDAWSHDRPDPLPEHGDDVDSTAVMLARLTVKVDDDPEGPTLAAEAVGVDNDIRRMVPAIGPITRPPSGV